jgi:hypothetical protein
MSSKLTKNAMVLAASALSVAGAVAIVTAGPSRAAPSVTGTAALKAAASIQVTDVYYRRHGYYHHGYYGRRYYGHGYYRRRYYGYGYPYYYGGYAYPYYYPYGYSYSYPFFGFGFGW